MTSPSPSFLEDNRNLQVLLFGGKGGVGKTTCATATALQLARCSPKRSLLLVSTDPAHSLQDSLADLTPLPNLTVLELDAQQCLDTFREKNAGILEQIASAGTFLDDEDIHRVLTLSLPGADELMAFLEISGWVESAKYDCIVVDTAPSGHTLRLLEMPAVIRKWLGVLDAFLAKRRYMQKVFARTEAPDALYSFVSQWSDSVQRMESLLRDWAKCRFIPVTTADALAVEETVRLLHRLRDAKVPVSDVILNQLRPEGRCRQCSSIGAFEQRGMARLCTLGRDWPYSLWGISMFPSEARGAEILPRFWDHASPVTHVSASPRSPVPSTIQPTAGSNTQHPAEGLRLILVSGKGGVGKTTLACAIALRLAEDFPGEPTLLLSTDPKHTLSACVGVPIGSHPVEIRPNLMAMQVKAQTEFHAFQSGFSADLQNLLKAVSPKFDLTFDRVALEKMVDLAPPGLDEFMALTRIIDLLAHNSYQRIVVDSASTGHLIRLLELPDLLDQWVKTFFGLLLKYEGVLQMPRFTEELIQLSKDLKRFRALLTDAKRAALYTVAIPTEMALAETGDLLTASRRLGIAALILFLNMLTPPSDCSFCAALRHREGEIVNHFQSLCKDQVLIYRQPGLAGLDSFELLGRSLFAPLMEVVHG